MQETSRADDAEEYKARLGVVLQLGRKAAGITQVQAAAALGMTPVSFTRWEKGETGISAYDLARLVRLYGLDVDAMLVFDPPASKVEIRRRLDPVAKAAQQAARRALLRPLPADTGDEGGPS